MRSIQHETRCARCREVLAVATPDVPDIKCPECGLQYVSKDKYPWLYAAVAAMFALAVAYIQGASGIVLVLLALIYMPFFHLGLLYVGRAANLPRDYIPMAGDIQTLHIEEGDRSKPG